MLITTNVRQRRKVFLNPSYAFEAIDLLYRVQALHPFFLYGFVIMPDHCHLLLRIPEPGQISMLMNRYKMGVSHSIGIGPIWQARFHVRIPSSGQAALQYIHQNPANAGLVSDATLYPWSSATGRWDVTDLGVW